MQECIPLVNRGFKELNPISLGQENCAPAYSFGPYIRDYHLIHYVKSGKGVLYNDSGAHEVKAGELFIIRPGQLTTYIADKIKPWHYIWVGFNGARARELMPFDRYVLPFSGDNFFQMLEAKGLTNTREEYIVGQLYTVLALLNSNENLHPGYAQQAADYIRANYMQAIKVEEIAKMIGLDRRYLGRLFKASMGLGMQEFLIETRLKHAAQYLNRGETVASAAFLCGYNDAFNFSKMFKKHFGISPQQYAKQRK